MILFNGYKKKQGLRTFYHLPRKGKFAGQMIFILLCIEIQTEFVPLLKEELVFFNATVVGMIVSHIISFFTRIQQVNIGENGNCLNKNSLFFFLISLLEIIFGFALNYKAAKAFCTAPFLYTQVKNERNLFLCKLQLGRQQKQFQRHT